MPEDPGYLGAQGDAADYSLAHPPAGIANGGGALAFGAGGVLTETIPDGVSHDVNLGVGAVLNVNQYVEGGGWQSILSVQNDPSGYFTIAFGVGPRLTVDGTNITLGSPVLLPSLPTADPGVADQPWCDTTAGRVVKISAGP